MCQTWGIEHHQQWFLCPYMHGEPSCEIIYVGQRHDIPHRLGDHTRAKNCPSMKKYTLAKYTFLQQMHELYSANGFRFNSSISLSQTYHRKSA